MKRAGCLELTWQGLLARLTQPRRRDSTSLLFFEGTPNHKTHNTQDAITGSFNPALTHVACYTGSRLDESLALRWDWIDLEEGLIYLPYSKTIKDRTGRGQKVVLQRAVIDLLKSLPTRSENVFTQANGEPFKHWHIENAFRKVVTSLGIDTKRYLWKELRHTTATLMKLKGAEISSIKDQLRHTSIRTTEKFYIGSDIDFQRAQIELLSFRGGKKVGSGVEGREKNLPSA